MAKNKREQQQESLAEITKGTQKTSPVSKMISDQNADLTQGNIRPTGVGLREGEIGAIDAIARNALIRIAV